MSKTALNPDTDLSGYMTILGEQARAAAAELRLATSEQKIQALNHMATEIRGAQDDILAANAIDMESAETKGISWAQ